VFFKKSETAIPVGRELKVERGICREAFDMFGSGADLLGRCKI
jgi:hypothetical protein